MTELRGRLERRARAAWGARRGRGRGGAGLPRADAPAWLRITVETLPVGAQRALRAALGPDAEVARARAILAELRRERQALQNRERALEIARDELQRGRQALDEVRAETAAARAAAERRHAAAERAANEAAVVRRVPVGQIRWSAEDSPRPLVGVARLAANIERFGQLTPVVVRPAERAGHYDLVTGFRRMAALTLARCPHADVRILSGLDAATAAALYVAENCLSAHSSPNAVRELAERVGERPGFAEILPLVLADDEAAVETLSLDALAAQALRDLREAAAWVSALRPHWADLEPDERAPIEQLIGYFGALAERLR